MNTPCVCLAQRNGNFTFVDSEIVMDTCSVRSSSTHVCISTRAFARLLLAHSLVWKQNVMENIVGARTKQLPAAVKKAITAAMYKYGFTLCGSCMFFKLIQLNAFPFVDTQMNQCPKTGFSGVFPMSGRF